MEGLSKENEVAFDDVLEDLNYEDEQEIVDDDDWDSEEDDYGIEDMASDWDCTEEEVLEAWAQE